jgi:hypothetical protein
MVIIIVFLAGDTVLQGKVRDNESVYVPSAIQPDRRSREKDDEPHFSSGIKYSYGHKIFPIKRERTT